MEFLTPLTYSSSPIAFILAMIISIVIVISIVSVLVLPSSWISAVMNWVGGGIQSLVAKVRGLFKGSSQQ